MADSARVRWGAFACVVVALGIVLVGDNAPTSGDPGMVLQVRQWSRVISLTTAAGGAAAAIERGQPGDEVWLDRRAAGNSAVRLGSGVVAGSETAARTGEYPYVGGAVRACGTAGDRAEIRCTRWVEEGDPAPDRRLRAVERLLDRYDRTTGLWENDSSTWQSANALTALIDYMARTGDRQYVSYIDETYRHGTVSEIGVPKYTGYNDDELWWALAWLGAFDLTGEPRYLDAARTIVDGLDDQRAAFCDGGLAWARVGVDPQLRPWTQVNTITNGLHLTATALLSTRVEPASRPSYLARAEQTRQWFFERAGRALFDRSGLINDHLDQYGDTCLLVDPETRWTYNQGAMIGGLVALHDAAGGAELLRAADAIAVATTGTGSPFLSDGVLREPAAVDCPGPDCQDAETFKGVLVRAYRELLAAPGSTATRDFLTRQADSLTGTADEYGFRWHAPVQDDDRPNFATQAAAIDAFNGA
ncbi:hypothetical protein HLB23_00995 [Nocardia uniformis]|uniref:Uncharacterized protein n=1 Tax=Nocardia uniformis TaxID=53432 RepID=A0A849BP30_9NOCA|nr:glycoside hydrolase family 76 protein [Nocardia uniformis]NNH68472.1 hypothetical protein [Nocardia uniformis]